MRPHPVLSEEEEEEEEEKEEEEEGGGGEGGGEKEEQGLVEWTTDCSRKGFSQRKMVDPLYVKEFLTINHRKRLLNLTCLGMDGSERSYAVLLSCPLALVKVCVPQEVGQI
jgi:hypothetical protein